MVAIFVFTERLQMNTDEMTMREAMTLFYGDIERQGPGDGAFTKSILRRLPNTPENSRIADLGCGTGAGSMLLAQHYSLPVLCVDKGRLLPFQTYTGLSCSTDLGMGNATPPFQGSYTSTHLG
ncbi:hypothetical protein [Pseudosulfitobacter sp. SM2401]|uniref:hypothetical protein n=1 Tax=Pseudosulfitobacter sp. SM2401 TaxID=3350098 RepID=UPI0036F3DF04